MNAWMLECSDAWMFRRVGVLEKGCLDGWSGILAFAQIFDHLFSLMMLDH